MKARVLTAVAVFALAAGAPPVILDSLGAADPPLTEIQAYIQHINILTS